MNDLFDKVIEAACSRTDLPAHANKIPVDAYKVDKSYSHFCHDSRDCAFKDIKDKRQ